MKKKTQFIDSPHIFTVVEAVECRVLMLRFGSDLPARLAQIVKHRIGCWREKLKWVKGLECDERKVIVCVRWQRICPQSNCRI